jgi:hypothetical protein
MTKPSWFRVQEFRGNIRLLAERGGVRTDGDSARDNATRTQRWRPCARGCRFPPLTGITPFCFPGYSRISIGFFSDGSQELGGRCFVVLARHDTVSNHRL